MIESRRRWIHAALAATAAVVAGGCTRPSPVKGMFVLEPATPGPVAKTQKGLLLVANVSVAAPFRGRQFVFRESDLKYETDYYNEFLVAPAANIGEATARALASAKVFAAVAPSSVTLDPDWVLSGFVESLYGDGRNAAKPEAVFAITYFLRRQAGDLGVPIWTRTYDKHVPFANGSASAYVTALNTGFGEVLAELSRDLSALSLP